MDVLKARPRQYKLDGHTPVPMRDDQLREWGEWFAKADRIVKQEYVGPYYISTVFLGLDHALFEGRPLLFETMIFSDGAAVDYQDRCSTWAEALEMHRRGVEWATAKAR
jgi:hypothetical protein